jgi:hypothetical protein
MPECVTCGGYVSPDFVRVFGDNSRVVRSCLSCHGTEPDHVESDDQSTVEVESVTAGSVGDDEQSATSTQHADSLDEEGTSGGAVEYETTEYETPEPETATTTGDSSSRLGFLRSVFSK